MKENSINIQGIILRGIVIGRAKKDNVGTSKQTIVTYKIQADDQLYYVKEWMPDLFNCPAIGEEVELPIRVTMYNSQYQYTVRKDNQSLGEEF